MAYQSIIRCPDGNAPVKIISNASIVNPYRGGSILCKISKYYDAG